MRTAERGAALGAALAIVASGLLISPSATADGGERAAVRTIALAEQHDDRQRAADLTDDVVVAHTDDGLAARYRVQRWPGRRIRYHETIPAKWQWGLDKAIAHWNSSGADIRFVKTSARRAQLKISYGDTGGADGIATIGYQRTNFVHLSPAYRDVEETDPQMRVWVGRLFTHELGHVLGFDHSGGCTLMTPVFVFGSCPLLSEERPGYYACRWIDKRLLRRFVNTYGGSARRPNRLCLIAPKPPQLEDVRFTGGQAEGRPVEIGWRVPERSPSGTRVRLHAWPGTTCGGAPPGSAFEGLLPISAGTWLDDVRDPGTWCYRIAVENRYGAARRPFAEARERWAPVPAAPVIGPLTWHPDTHEFTFEWTRPEQETELVVMRDVETGACVPVHDPAEAFGVDAVDADTWSVQRFFDSECLTFFAVTPWGTVSPGTPVQAVVPPPE